MELEETPAAAAATLSNSLPSYSTAPQPQHSAKGDRRGRGWKPSRACVLITLGILIPCAFIYRMFRDNEDGDDDPIPMTPPPLTGMVNILLDERNPYNVTVTSDLDVVQSLAAGGARVEISLRDLLANRSAGPGAEGPVRITRADGERSARQLGFEAHLSWEKKRETPRLTSLDQIKPSPLNIFFIETRCGTAAQRRTYADLDAGVIMNARQICSVESTARLNPRRSVYILHSCPLDDSFYDKSPSFVQQLMTSYQNVHLVHLDMERFFMRTSVEDLFFGGRFEESRHPVEHVSDVVRLLTLWKYGGTYMDIDVVSIKFLPIAKTVPQSHVSLKTLPVFASTICRPLDDLGFNFAGWQDSTTVASGVLNFSPGGIGHRLLSECLDRLRSGFDPHNWSTNGPLLVTDTLTRLCGIAPHSGGRECGGFTAYPEPVFYPLYYTEWRDFFNADPTACASCLRRLNSTYVVHIWNRMSAEAVVDVGGAQAYGALADKYCPKTYWNCGPTF